MNFRMFEVRYDRNIFIFGQILQFIDIHVVVEDETEMPILFFIHDHKNKNNGHHRNVSVFVERDRHALAVVHRRIFSFSPSLIFVFEFISQHNNRIEIQRRTLFRILFSFVRAVSTSIQRSTVFISFHALQSN